MKVKIDPYSAIIPPDAKGLDKYEGAEEPIPEPDPIPEPEPVEDPVLVPGGGGGGGGSHTGGAPAPGAYMMDTNATQYGIYSVKLESSTYSGPLMRIQREDGTEVDIDSNSGNGLSLTGSVSNASAGGPYADLAAFAGTDDCILMTWYDQEENADLSLWEAAEFNDNPKVLIGGALLTTPELLGTEIDTYTETYAYPLIRWEYGKLSTAPVGILGNDSYPTMAYNNLSVCLLARFMDPEPLPDNDSRIFSFRPQGFWAHESGGMSIRMQDWRTDDDVVLGQGTSQSLITSHRLAMFSFDMGPTISKIFVNRREDSNTGTTTSNTISALQFGGESKGSTNYTAMDVGSLFVFPNLSDTGREAIFDDYVQPDWGLSAPVKGAAPNSTSLPCDFDWQVTLYDWLAAFVEADFDMPTGSISWDGSGTDQQKADLWLRLRDHNGGNQSWEKRDINFFGASKHYVKDDGTGWGWDGKGIAAGNNATYVPYFDSGSHSYGLSLQAVYWGILTGTGLTNPLYDDAAVKNRALVSAALSGLKYFESVHADGGGDRTDFFGSIITVVSAPVWAFGDTLSAGVKEAFKQLILAIVNRCTYLGAQDVTGNMDCKAIEGCGFAYAAYAGDTAFQAKLIELCRMILFGKTDGSLTDIDSDRGIFYLEGLIREKDGPAMNYWPRGVSHVAANRSLNYGESDWDFLDDVIEDYADFASHYAVWDTRSVTPEWDTSGGGPLSGDVHSNRVHDAISTQGTDWLDIYIAQTYAGGGHFLVRNKFGARRKYPVSGDLTGDINSLISAQANFDLVADEPSQWSIESVWPTELPFAGPDVSATWFADLNAKYTAGDWKGPNHLDTTTAYIKIWPTAARGTVASVDPNNQEAQWVGRKDSDSGRWFDYFIEGIHSQGDAYARTYWSGQIINCGAVDQSHVISGFREKKGQKYDWGETALRRCLHVWGTDSGDLEYDFSNDTGTDRSYGGNESRTLAWADGDATGVGHVKTVKTPMNATGQNGTTFDYQFAHEAKFTGLSDGLQVDITVTNTNGSANQTKTMWHSIPLVQTYNASYFSFSTYTLEYKDNDDVAWTTVPTDRSEFTAQYLRIGTQRDALGVKYSYIDLGADQTCRFLAPITVKDNVRCGIFDIDMHTNRGVVTTVPASTVLTWKWRITDMT